MVKIRGTWFRRWVVAQHKVKSGVMVDRYNLLGAGEVLVVEGGLGLGFSRGYRCKKYLYQYVYQADWQDRIDSGLVM